MPKTVTELAAAAEVTPDQVRRLVADRLLKPMVVVGGRRYFDDAAVSEVCELIPDSLRRRAMLVSRRFGQRVRSLRIDRKMTQATLAKECGMTQPRIADIERGRYCCQIDTLCLLADGLGAEVSDLLRV